MRIKEILETDGRITRNSGTSVEIDHGDGTKTTVDTNKNPDALVRDERGQLRLNKNSNSAMNKKTNQPARSGEKVDIDDES